MRARIQSVLDWASARGLRQGDNPARWEGHLDKLLPRKSKVTKVEHHPALPFDELPTFIASLRERPAIAARALEFAILTAARTGEALGARWSEVDLNRKTWTVPAGRMKAGREHRVPLSDRAAELIMSMRERSRGDVIFPAADGLRPLSNMALSMMLRRMKRDDLTVHGFRSTFRDWVAERTDFPGEVAEMALAHGVRNQVEAAYRRGDRPPGPNRVVWIFTTWTTAGSTSPLKGMTSNTSWPKSSKDRPDRALRYFQEPNIC